MGIGIGIGPGPSGTGCEVVVATPSRLTELVAAGLCPLDRVRMLVLDRAGARRIDVKGQFNNQANFCPPPLRPFSSGLIFPSSTSWVPKFESACYNVIYPNMESQSQGANSLVFRAQTTEGNSC